MSSGESTAWLAERGRMCGESTAQLDNGGYRSTNDLVALADLTSSIYLDMKRHGHERIATAFALAYLRVAEEIEQNEQPSANAKLMA